MEFLTTPNLPEGKVSAVLLGQAYTEILEVPLRRLGVSVIPVPPNPSVDSRLSSHADLSVFHLGGNRLVCAHKSAENLKHLADLGFELIPARLELSPEYPGDCRLCAVSLGDVLICREDSTDPVILESAAEAGMRIINSRQGYCKCTLCPVDERSVITEDPGCAKILTAQGFDVLLIPQGSIRLDGFPHGFIGGAAVKLSRELLAFTGRLDSFPFWPDVRSFLRKRGVEAVFLTEESCFDVGSVIPVELSGKV